MGHNERGYGHGRFAGVFAVAQRQSECGRKTRKVHISQPVNIGVCYAVVVWFSFKRVCLLFSHKSVDYSEIYFHSSSNRRLLSNYEKLCLKAKRHVSFYYFHCRRKQKQSSFKDFQFCLYRLVFVLEFA